MNSFAYAALSDAASVAASLAAAAAAGALPPGSLLGPWHYAADAALFGNASASLRASLVATLWNASAGAFNAAVLGDADAIAAGGLQPLGPSYYGTSAWAGGVKDPATAPCTPDLARCQVGLSSSSSPSSNLQCSPSPRASSTTHRSALRPLRPSSSTLRTPP